MSKNSSATKLPSQVAKIGKQAEALAIETGVKPGSKPVETASSKLVPVETEPTRIDPEDYKTRFTNYKKTTDQTIFDLRKTLADTQATLTESQRQNQSLLAELKDKPANTIETVDDTSTAGTKNDPAFKAYLARLPESIKNEYQEDYLFDQFIMQSTAGAGTGQDNSDAMSNLEQKVDSIVHVQEKSQYELYEEAMDSAFPNDEWITLTKSQEWSNFCLQTVSAVDPRSYGDIVEEGNVQRNSTTVIWVINKFKDSLSTLEEGGGESTNEDLSIHLTPEGAGGGGGDPISQINAQAETFTHSQVTQFFTDVATTKKYTAEEAASIEKSILAAQAADKIIPG